MTLWANGVMRNSDKSTLPSVADFQTPPMWRVNPFSVDHVRVNNLSICQFVGAHCSPRPRGIFIATTLLPRRIESKEYILTCQRCIFCLMELLQNPWENGLTLRRVVCLTLYFGLISMAFIYHFRYYNQCR